MAGAKKLHTFLGHSTHGFNGVMLQLTLQGLRRGNEHIIKRALPMTPAILKLVHSKLDHTNSNDVVFWGACLLAFFLLFRKSNLLPNTQNGFNPRKQLKFGDCVQMQEQVVVGIRWAKNEQFYRELFTFPLARLPGSVLCPVLALNNIAKMVKHTKDCHVFKLKNGNSLTYRNFQDKLRTTLRSVGIPNTEGYSSHSFRRGGTTFSFLCGIPTEIIKLLGNWRSNAFLAYIEFPLETRTAACELMKLHILALGAQKRL